MEITPEGAIERLDERAIFAIDGAILTPESNPSPGVNASMDQAALAIAILALLAAFRASSAAAAAKKKLEELESDARRGRIDAEDALARATRCEGFLKLLAGGTPLDPGMIEEGRLFPEIDSEKARRLVENERPKDLVVVDVRTEQEVAGGHIEHALWIPVDQIEKRAREIPRNGTVLVVCAAGSRSAAACDFLSSHGWSNVTNVVGGMSGYRGKTVTGVPGKS